MIVFNVSLVCGSFSLRSLSNESWARARRSCGWLIGYMLRSTRIWRRWSCDRAPPRGPDEALTIAAGLPFHELSPPGRLPHSIAFFNTAVTVRVRLPDLLLEQPHLSRRVMFMV